MQSLETSFIVDGLEFLPEEGLDNAVQVGLRAGEKRGVLVVICVNDERLRLGDEPEVDGVAQGSS